MLTTIVSLEPSGRLNFRIGSNYKAMMCRIYKDGDTPAPLTVKAPDNTVTDVTPSTENRPLPEDR